MDTLVFAYYCSGHGYGHATRVSAFARHLLSLGLNRRLTIRIVSSAPRHVFADSISCGALYRFADIDPVIVQPLAYRVDRQKSVQVLEDFLGKKDAMLDRERRWLIETGANCVLSDAAFLGCLAAKSAGIPSILITNFTFDSVYSYLATSLVDAPSPLPITPSTSTLSPSSSTTTDVSFSSSGSEQLFPDVPIAQSTLTPLVSQLHEGYQHADLLLRLPGHIPIPSFLNQPVLPSSHWVDPNLNRFHDPVTKRLLSSLNTEPLHAPKSFPGSNITIPRSVRAAPLLVRPPSPGIYTPEGRALFLQKNGLPNFQGMRILVVSFGGQVFKRPGASRTNSRMQSRFPSQEALVPSRSGGFAVDPNTDNQPKCKNTQSKRSSKDYQGFHKTSASLDRLALKPRDMNTGATQDQSGLLDLDAVNKGLGTYIKSASRESRKQSPRRKSGKNTSDHVFNDVDNGNSSQQESDQDVNNATFNEAIATAQRRHTLPRRKHNSHGINTHRRLATPSHLLIPGAPPASKPLNTLLRTPSLGRGPINAPSTKREHADVKLPEMCVIPPTPKPGAFTDALPTPNFRKGNFLNPGHANPPYASLSSEAQNSDQAAEDGDIGLLPDENWIAVICGVSKEQWNAENEEGGLPEGFYVAPRDVYMPDLIAAGDVVLGKLGYGMTSECVDACTPFVYVSRPLFIEEHGLRMYLDQEGVGVELSRAGYENGEWARSVEEAYCKGWEIKQLKGKKEFAFCMWLKQLDKMGVENSDERRLSVRERQGREMARGVIEWVDRVRDTLGGGGAQNTPCVDGNLCEDLVATTGIEANEILVTRAH